ncbi:TetR/AcrR family transcriptional regulator [Temperatibacter marinus]|uniref:TetR/AcrR family transcriptional regulator n=1 Tax=Temperatibacter marinus TaxID=1456591 RepID=A0AA52EJP4_9PROT|nr:TetR/AcrR family transcriptional regulator [Temperatibacter marinus]WND03762.1 TetR/AcrR family transcriptional regulator [Temperatibacter marinus]
MNDKRMEAALDVFLQYGFKKTSMEDIARGMGISRQAVYKNYKSKQDVLINVIIYFSEKSIAESFAILQQQEECLYERLLKMYWLVGGQFIERLRSSPHSHEVMFQVEENHDKVNYHDHFENMLKTVLTASNFKPVRGALDDVVATIRITMDGLIHGAKNEEEFMEGAKHILNALIPSER